MAGDHDERGKQARPGLIGELAHFLRYNKAWWITPIVLVLALLLFLLVFGGSSNPFTYPIF